MRYGIGVHAINCTFSEYTKQHPLVIGKDESKLFMDSAISSRQVGIFMEDGYVNLIDYGSKHRTYIQHTNKDTNTRNDKLLRTHTLSRYKTLQLSLAEGFSDLEIPETYNQYRLEVKNKNAFVACIKEHLIRATHGPIPVSLENDLPITCDCFPDKVIFSCESTQYAYTKQDFINALTLWIDTHVESNERRPYTEYRQTQQAYRSHTIALNRIHRTSQLPALPYCKDSTFSIQVTLYDEKMVEFKKCPLQLSKSTTVYDLKHRVAIACGIPLDSEFTIDDDYDDTVPVVEQIAAVKDETNITLNVNVSPKGSTPEAPKVSTPEELTTIHIIYSSENHILNVRVEGELENLSGVYRQSTTLANKIITQKQGEKQWPFNLTDSVTYYFKNNDPNNRLEYGTQTVLTHCDDIYDVVKKKTTMVVTNGFVFYATPECEWCPTLIHTTDDGRTLSIHTDSYSRSTESDASITYIRKVSNKSYSGNVYCEHLDSINITVTSLDGQSKDLGCFLLTETVTDIKRTYEAAIGKPTKTQKIFTHDGEIANDDQTVNTLELPLTVQIVD